MVERQDKQPDQLQQTAQRSAQRAGARSEDAQARPEGNERSGGRGEDMAGTAGRTNGQLQGEIREMTQHGIGEAAEAAQRGAEVAEEGVRHLADTAADRIQHFGEVVAQASREVADNTRLLMTVANGNALQEWRQASSHLMERIVETNARFADELFQRSSPAHLISLQQRFIREYLQTVSAGSRSLFQAAQRLAEQATQPLEREEQRQGGNGQSRGTVADVMSRDVRVIQPDSTVKDIARLMTEADTGALPVQEGDRLIGMVTDRDIAVRLVAEGKDPSQTRVREVMTPGLRYVFEDEDLEHVAGNMAEQQVRRLPVMNRQKRLVGMLSLGDLAAHQLGELAGRALGAAQPGGQRDGQRAAR